MTGAEYQKQAMRTCNIPVSNTRDRLYHAVLLIASEAGEVAGILQKEYQGHPVSYGHLKRELGDVLWGIAEACEALGCTMDDVMQTNIDKLMSRYPEGFDPDKSLHRAEGDL